VFDRAAWARILPFLVYLLFIVVADLLTQAGAGAAALRWLYPVKIAVVTCLLVVFLPQYEELKTSRPAPLLALAAGVLVFVLWISLNARWMQVGSSAGYDPRVDGALYWPLIAIRLAGAALVVPVMEELFWRSFLLRWIAAPAFQSVAPRTVGLKSFMLTMVLFGVEHNLWLAGMVAGAVYGLLYMRTGNLWNAILAHGVTNGVLGIWIIYTGNWTYW